MSPIHRSWSHLPWLLVVLLVILGKAGLWSLAAADTPPAEDPVNFCHDSTSWHTWDALLQKHPEDQALLTLHALRLGLCVKVDRGDVTVDEATVLFETARAAVLRQWQEERRQAEQRSKL